MAKVGFCLIAVGMLILMVGARAEEVKMQFYMHDVVVGQNRTAIALGVGSITRLGFGAMVAIDDVLTENSSPSSTVIGRARGLYMVDSLQLTQPDLLLVFTAVFESPPEYRGSTLSIQGSDKILMDQREVSVVGGTGKFRYAKGYATIQTFSTSLLANAVLGFNVTLKLD